MTDPRPNGQDNAGPPQKKAAPKTDLAELRRSIRALPANARLNAILACPDVIRVVRSLPVQDLYATVREVGPADSLELVELLDPRQVQGFLDLDGWRHDRLDAVSIGDWLEVLFAANPMKAARQVRGLDVELLTLLLKVHTKVYDLQEEEGPEDDVDLHSVTPDNRYLVVYERASGSDKLLQGLKATVDLLFGRDLKFITRLLQSVRWEVPSALEEEAYRWRNARLGDLGFPPPEEAHAVFAWLDPDQGSPTEPAEPPPMNADPEEASTNLSTSVLLSWDLLEPGASVLGGAMGELGVGTAERVSHELMLCANQVHFASGGDLGDPGALRDTVQRVTDTVGVALSYLSQGEPARAPEKLAQTPVRTLFRQGHSLGLRLQREMRGRTKDERCGLDDAGLLLLDSPLREVTAGILRRRPLFFVGLTEPARMEFRHFASLPELAETARALTEAAFRATVFGPAGLKADRQALVELGFEDLAEVPSHGVLLATALARVVLGGELSVGGPLDDAELQGFAAKLEGDGRRQLNDADRGRAVAAAEELGRGLAPAPGAATADEAGARARAFAETALRLVDDELGGIEGEPDPRFVTALWTKAAAEAARLEREERRAKELVER